MDNIKYEDKLFRWGGEEFLLVAENIYPYEQKDYVKQIRDNINNLKFMANGEEFSISISLGGSYLKNYTDKKSIHKIIKLADDNLYKSKNNGKNQYTNE